MNLRGLFRNCIRAQLLTMTNEPSRHLRLPSELIQVFVSGEEAS